MVSKPKITDQQAVRKKATLSSFDDEFLDTDRLRQLPYGNLVLRRQSHRFLSQGVLVAMLFLALFWLVAANWQRVTQWTGFFREDKPNVVCYEVVTLVTQLPPPAPLDRPVPVAGKSAAPSSPASLSVPFPPSVGKVKQVSQEEAPAQQTVATQKEMREATQAQVSQTSSSNAGVGNAATGDETSMFVTCDKMPSFLDQKKPAYPEMARIAGITGKVFVRVLIGEDGRPIKAMIIKRIPANGETFDAVAIKSVMASKYYPGILNGQPVKVWFTVPIRFQLD